MSRAEALVHHLAVAGASDDRSIDLTLATATALVGRTPSVARRLLEAVLVQLSGHRLAEGRVAASTALVAGRLGDLGAARRHAATALSSSAGPDVHLVARTALATVSVSTGAMADAVAELDRAAATPGIDADDRLRCEAQRAYYRIWSFDLVGARRDAIDILERTGHRADTVAIESAARAHEVMALTDLAHGRANDALRHAQAAHAVLGETADADAVDSLVHQALGLALLDNDRLADSLSAVGRGLAIAEERGTRGVQAFYANSAAMISVVGGRLDDAVALADTAIAILDGAPASPVAGLPLAVHGRVALARGDHATARSAMDAAAAGFAASGPVLGGLAYLTWLGEVHHATGDVAAARDTLSLAWQLGAPARYLIVWRSLAVALARVDVDAPLDADLRTDLRDAVATGATSADVTSARAVSTWVTGLLDRDADAVADAADLLEGTGRVLDLAQCLVDAARLRRGSGRPDAGCRRLTARAQEVAVPIGAFGIAGTAAGRHDDGPDPPSVGTASHPPNSPSPISRRRVSPTRRSAPRWACPGGPPRRTSHMSS